MNTTLEKTFKTAAVIQILITAGCTKNEPIVSEATPEPSPVITEQPDTESEPAQEPDVFEEESDIDFESLRNIYYDTQGLWDITPYELIDVLTVVRVNEELKNVSFLLKEGEGYPAKYYVYSYDFGDGFVTDTLQEISASWLIIEDMASSRIIDVPHVESMDTMEIVAGEGNDHPVELPIELPEIVEYMGKEYKIYPKGLLSLNGSDNTVICGAKAADKENRVLLITKEADGLTVKNLDMIGYVWPSVMEALNASDSGFSDTPSN